MKKNIPNILTTVRLFMVPLMLVVWFNTFKWDKTTGSRFMWAAVIFLIASATDFLDGFLARKNKCVSSFGKIADPIADKALTISALICILYVTKSTFGMILAAIIIFREVAVSVMRMVYAKKGIVLAAGLPGKIKTVFQMIGLFTCMCFVYDNEKYLSFATSETMNLSQSTNLIIAIAAVLTVFSGVWCFVNAGKTKKEAAPGSKSKKK